MLHCRNKTTSCDFPYVHIRTYGECRKKSPRTLVPVGAGAGKESPLFDFNRSPGTVVCVDGGGPRGEVHKTNRQTDATTRQKRRGTNVRKNKRKRSTHEPKTPVERPQNLRVRSIQDVYFEAQQCGQSQDNNTLHLFNPCRCFARSEKQPGRWQSSRAV